MIEEDELIADITEVLSQLVTDGSLELASRQNGPSSLGAALAETLERDAAKIDLEEWFLDRDEVVELYIDAAALEDRMMPVLKRLAYGDASPKWNDALTEAIYRDPEDENAWLVFGDWLHQEGDPRGELIALQAKKRIADEEEDAVLDEEGMAARTEVERRALSLLKRFRKHFYGDLSDDEHGYAITFRHGYFDEARIGGEQLDRLLALHSSRFLRSLVVTAGLEHAAKTLTEMTTTSLPKSLSTVRLGHLNQGREEEVEIEIGAAFDGLDRLKLLEVAAGTVTLSPTLRLPGLKKLIIQAEELRLPPIVADDPPRFPALVELTIREPREEIENVELIHALLKQPLVAVRLEVFEAEPYLRALASAPSSLRRLQKLDLRDTGVSVEGTELLEKHFAHVEVVTGDDPDAEEYDDDDDDDDDDDYGDDSYSDPGLIPNEDEPEAATEEDDEDVENEELKDEDEDLAVDKDAPIEERERFDDPVE